MLLCDGTYGIINYFLQLKSPENNSLSVVALVNPLVVNEVTFEDVSLHHLLKAKVSASFKFIPVASIQSKCVFVEIGSAVYVAKPVHNKALHLAM